MNDAVEVQRVWEVTDSPYAFTSESHAELVCALRNLGVVYYNLWEKPSPALEHARELFRLIAELDKLREKVFSNPSSYRIATENFMRLCKFEWYVVSVRAAKDWENWDTRTESQLIEAIKGMSTSIVRRIR